MLALHFKARNPSFGTPLRHTCRVLEWKSSGTHRCFQ